MKLDEYTNTIRHIGLVVKDINKSIHFWCEMLGFKIISDQLESGKNLSKILNLKNVKVRTVKIIDKNKNMLELLYFINKKNNKSNRSINLKTNHFGFTHLALTVNKINKLYRILKKNKIKFTTKPLFSKDKKVKLTYLKSPEGIYIELVQKI